MQLVVLLGNEDRAEVTQLEGVAVLVQRDGLDVEAVSAGIGLPGKGVVESDLLDWMDRLSGICHSNRDRGGQTLRRPGPQRIKYPREKAGEAWSASPAGLGAACQFCLRQILPIVFRG